MATKPIRTSCPGCNTPVLITDPERMGRPTTCPACGRLFLARAASVQTAPPPPPALARHRDDDEDDGAYEEPRRRKSGGSLVLLGALMAFGLLVGGGAVAAAAFWFLLAPVNVPVPGPVVVNTPPVNPNNLGNVAPVGEPPVKDGRAVEPLRPGDGGKALPTNTDGKKPAVDRDTPKGRDTEREKDKEKDKAQPRSDDSKPPDDPPRAPGETRRFALLIGLNEYDSRDFPDLRFAEADIEALAALLIKGGYAKEDVIVLTGKRGENERALKPTADNINAAVKKMCGRLRDNDVLLIAFAGHGVEPARGQHSFCAYKSAKKDGEFINLVSINDVVGSLNKAKGALKLLLVDACRNDPGARSLPDADEGFRSATAPPVAQNTVAFYSCSPGERSWEPGDLKQGLFMYHILEGLREKANFYQDGKIAWGALVSYTDREVRSYSRNVLRKLQQPHFKGEVRGSVPALIEWPTPEKPIAAAPEADKQATRHLQLSEDFLGVKPPTLPRGWKSREVRTATDKNKRHCLETVGTEGVKEIDLPRVSLAGDFFIEIEYLLDGYYEAQDNAYSQWMYLTLEGNDGERRLRADVTHTGRGRIGTTDRRGPANYKPWQVTRFRLEREGNDYRILINDEFAAGGRQDEKGEFDSVRIGLTAGNKDLRLNVPARIYSVKVGRMGDKSKDEGGAAIVKEGSYTLDLDRAKLGGLPAGWQSEDWFLATDKENRRCLEVKGENSIKMAALPGLGIKGDFFLDLEADLDGWGNGSEFRDKHNQHLGIVLIAAGNVRVPIEVDFVGRAVIGNSLPRAPGDFQNKGRVRLRVEREAGVFRVRVNDSPALGWNLGVTGDIEGMQIGLTAGKPGSRQIPARLYGLRLGSKKPDKEKPEERPAAPAGGVREDFKTWKIGILPEGWTASKSANMTIQPGRSRQALELIRIFTGEKDKPFRGDQGDIVQLPAINLPGKFIASFECVLPPYYGTVVMGLSGARTEFAFGLTSEKQLLIPEHYFPKDKNGKPTQTGFDVTKHWRTTGEPQLVQIERNEKAFLIKFNDELVTMKPLGLGAGTFTVATIKLLVKDEHLVTPRVTNVKIVPIRGEK